MSTWSSVICEAIFDLTFSRHSESQVHMDMKSIRHQIQQNHGRPISKQFLYKKLGQLNQIGLVQRETTVARSSEKRRGRPLSNLYSITSRGISYLHKKGRLAQEVGLGMHPRKIEVVSLNAPKGVKPVDFAIEHYSKIGYSVAETSSELINTNSQLPMELQRAISVGFAGMPAYLVFKPDFSEYFFMDCKGANAGVAADTLSWLSETGAPYRFIQVRTRIPSKTAHLLPMDGETHKKLKELAKGVRARAGRKMGLGEVLDYAAKSLDNGSKMPEIRENVLPTQTRPGDEVQVVTGPIAVEPKAPTRLRREIM